MFTSGVLAATSIDSRFWALRFSITISFAGPKSMRAVTPPQVFPRVQASRETLESPSVPFEVTMT